MTNINKIAKHLQIEPEGISATITLLDSGNTVPFIARYRKEVTGGLDEEQIRDIKNMLGKLRSLDERRETILRTIETQGKLTEEIKGKIIASGSQTELEDLYQPYKPRRKTRASLARGKGLEPLAETILKQPTDLQITKSVDELTVPYLSDKVPTPEEAWAGARDILAEIISDNSDVRRMTREKAQKWARLVSKKTNKGEDPRGLYHGYYDFENKVDRLFPYQILAINRGEREKILGVKIRIPERDWRYAVDSNYPRNPSSPLAEHHNLATLDAADRLLLPAISRDIRRSLTEQAEVHAIQVFAKNLRNLLYQPPIPDRVVLAIDPGYRTGCKVAVVDTTGKPIETNTIYPHSPQKRSEEAKQILQDLITRHEVTLIAVGNGTASRETEILIARLIQESTNRNISSLRFLIVSEAGASVYSASKLARSELPEMDVSMRGAVSIARRVQDPLAELVKIDPKSIGVGMYQHDVNQKKLASALDDVVESVVNLTGVDLNSASPALLTYVSGIGPSLAGTIIDYRNQHGPFPDRKTLMDIPGLGPKAFEQCAGFLRIRKGNNPLDNSAIHPESYPVAEKLLQQAGMDLNASAQARAASIQKLLSNKSIDSLAAELKIGLPTLKDIVEQLKRPGRDPRQDLPLPILRSDILKMEDLKIGMATKGTIRNVVDFGAFVDIGVKQDGLLHRSKIKSGMNLSVGDIVEVEILNIEIDRGRISLDLSSDN
jgi:uncharacterized protein